MTDRDSAAPANAFSATYRVRFDEAGPDGRIRTSTLLRYAQDVAWRHSEDRGFDRDWYAARHLGWVVRGVELEILRPIAMGSSLTVTTAVIGHRRIWARRLAELRLPDGGLAGRVLTDWVILDARGRPVRIPTDFGLSFSIPELDGDILRLAPLSGDSGDALPLRVRPQELDPMGHVNNAAYLDWLEEALAGGVRRPDGGSAEVALVPRSARLEYLASVGPGEDLVVVLARRGSTWRAEVRRVVPPGDDGRGDGRGDAGGTVLRADGRLTSRPTSHPTSHPTSRPTSPAGRSIHRGGRIGSGVQDPFEGW
jgi:acyl-CoA thioesterase FadM